MKLVWMSTKLDNCDNQPSLCPKAMLVTAWIQSMNLWTRVWPLG